MSVIRNFTKCSMNLDTIPPPPSSFWFCRYEPLTRSAPRALARKKCYKYLLPKNFATLHLRALWEIFFSYNFFHGNNVCLGRNGLKAESVPRKNCTRIWMYAYLSTKIDCNIFRQGEITKAFLLSVRTTGLALQIATTKPSRKDEWGAPIKIGAWSHSLWIPFMRRKNPADQKIKRLMVEIMWSTFCRQPLKG